MELDPSADLSPRLPVARGDEPAGLVPEGRRVPAGAFESSGAAVTPAEIEAFLAEEPRALGVAEMMNFPAVAAGDPASLAKIDAARRAGDGHVDGHAPGLTGPALNAYLAAGVRS